MVKVKLPNSMSAQQNDRVNMSNDRNVSHENARWISANMVVLPAMNCTELPEPDDPQEMYGIADADAQTSAQTSAANNKQNRMTRVFG
jgi:hypothetical protein